jgi:hypothetical protein
MDKLHRALKVREDWKKKFKVDTALAYLDGAQNPGYPDDEWITINKVYSILKSQLPSLYAADPYFYVKLRRSFKPDPQIITAYEEQGRIRQAMLNYLKDHVKLKDKVRLSIQDAFFSYGVCKTYYYADMGDNPDAGKPMLDKNEDVMMDDNGEILREPEYIPMDEKYCVRRVHPDDFVWDEDAGPLEESWTWVAHRVKTTLAKMKDDKRFNKQAVKSLSGSNVDTGDEAKIREERQKGDVRGKTEASFFMTKKRKKEDSEPMEYWEIYLLDEGKWLVYADDADMLLIEPEKVPDSVDKSCFSILRFTYRDVSPYPIPPMSQGIDSQKEYNILRSMQLTHRKRFNRKYEVVPGALVDDTELEKLENGDDGTIISVQAIGNIQPIKDAPMDGSAYGDLNLLNMDMIELMGGSTGESRGIATADSATQAGIMDKRLEMREGDSMSMVIDFTLDIAKKLDRLVQVHLTEAEAVRVNGPQGEYWEIVKPKDYEDIDGEYEFTVNAGAMIPRMPHIERSSWMAFLTLLRNFPQLATSKRLMKRMAEMHHIEDEAMLDELDQIAQQVMGGQSQLPQQMGSQAGVSQDRPANAMAGQSGGVQSLNLPGAGNDIGG